MTASLFDRRWLLAGLTLCVLATPVPTLAKARRHHVAAAKPAPKPVSAPPAAPNSGIAAAVIPTEAGLLPDMTLGNVNAPVTVIEYASASCPHCAAWNSDVWPEFEKKYVATGKVHYVFRELLTSPAEYALSAFMIGRCAVAKSHTPQNAAPYFTVVNTFFHGQADYYKTGDLKPLQQDVTRQTGLTPAAQLDCVTDDTQIDAFYKTMNAHAEADKVTSTPTFFVNGKRTQGHDLKDLDDAIAAALPTP